MIHPTAILCADVVVPDGMRVGPFAVLGLEPEGEHLVPPRFGIGCVIRSHAAVYRGVLLGQRVHLGHHVLVRQSSLIGDDVSVGSGSVIEHSVTIRARARLHSRTFVPEESYIGEGAWIGPGVMFTNARYPNRPDTKAGLEGVRIGRDAVIGAGAVILPGVTIGSGALVGAGSLVADNVAQGAVVYGGKATERRVL